MVKTHVSNGLRKWASKGYVSDGYSQSMANAMDDITTAYKKPKKGQPAPSDELNGIIAKALDMVRFCYRHLRNISTNTGVRIQQYY